MLLLLLLGKLMEGWAGRNRQLFDMQEEGGYGIWGGIDSKKIMREKLVILLLLFSFLLAHLFSTYQIKLDLCKKSNFV